MPQPDTEKFRLRSFVERLVQQGHCVVHDEPIDLLDIAAVLDGNPKAVWFRNVGPEKTELVGNVMGARERLALALDADAAGFAKVMRERMGKPMAPIEVPSSAAPVHEVVLTGEDADLTKLPVHLQHGRDGGPYISASMDFARDPATGWTNIGCRRIMLRGPRTAGIDLIAPSDLKAIYLKASAKGDKLPVAYVIGGHPTTFLAAVAPARPMDELAVMGAMRGEPVPVVKCKTIDAYVPADAEYVLEGYLDARGHVEPEGPYGEYCGYYGVVKRNPLFHLTAITRRRDALFQTVTIGGRTLAHTDTSLLNAARAETAIWNVLEQAIREPVAVYLTGASGGMATVRVAMRQRNPGEAHPGRSRSHRRLRLSGGSDRSLVAGHAGRRQARLRLHETVRQGRRVRVHGRGAAGHAGARPFVSRGSPGARAGELSRIDGRRRHTRWARDFAELRQALCGRTARTDGRWAVYVEGRANLEHPLWIRCLAAYSYRRTGARPGTSPGQVFARITR